MFHANATHWGVAHDPKIEASTAATLHMLWKANLGSPSVNSPAVVFNQQLGESLIYVGNGSGQMSAYDPTGAPKWTYQVPTSTNSTNIQSSPAVFNGVVYFGDNDHSLYALDATTGTLICTYATSGVLAASPVVADPDGKGPVVFIGDSGPSGNTADGGHEWAINAVGNPAGQCTLKWSFDAFGNPPGIYTGQAGTYSSPAFGLDATGRPLVVFGSTEPDDSVYALDARDGSRVWRFQTPSARPDQDVGAPPTISPPGINGLADGVVYVTGKDAHSYALDLGTGLPVWTRSKLFSQAAAALSGNRVYISSGTGLIALNAMKGTLLWSASSPAMLSSPAVSGTTGNKIVFAGDVGGTFHGYDAQTGAPLFSFTTGTAAVISSPAISNGAVYVAGLDGNLYAFGP